MGDSFQQRLLENITTPRLASFIIKFYRIWVEVNKNVYNRADESLELEYKLDGKDLRVVFNISPKKSE